jgi:hypothetical protein
LTATIANDRIASFEMRDALTQLVVDVGRLPGAPGAELVVPLPPRGQDRRRRRPRSESVPLPLLKLRVHELLAELARRVSSALPETLTQASRAWDQVDALRLLDQAVHDEHQALLVAAKKLSAHESPEHRALALEAQLTLDAAVDLVALVERRLATLVRLRLREAQVPEEVASDSDPEATVDFESRALAALLPEGRPFLDLGAALTETAWRWA